jgi:hypothetical protein
MNDALIQLKLSHLHNNIKIELKEISSESVY